MDASERNLISPVCPARLFKSPRKRTMSMTEFQIMKSNLSTDQSARFHSWWSSSLSFYMRLQSPTTYLCKRSCPSVRRSVRPQLLSNHEYGCFWGWKIISWYLKQYYNTVCFFSTETKEDGIIQLIWVSLISAIGHFKAYCLAFMPVSSKTLFY